MSRGVLGGVLGLLLGVALAFVLQRFDRRIRTRGDAEGAFTLPVLADVPEITKVQQRDCEIVAATVPLSRAGGGLPCDPLEPAVQPRRHGRGRSRAERLVEERHHGRTRAAASSSPRTTSRSWS